MTVSSLHKQMVDLYEAGQINDAMLICQRILKENAEDHCAIHLLGIFMLHLGDLKRSIDLIRTAIEINPHDPSYFNNLAVALMRAERLIEALLVCHKALLIDQKNEQVLNTLIGILRNIGEEELVECTLIYRRCVVGEIPVPATFISDFWNNQASLLQKNSQFELAELILKSMPVLPSPFTHFNLGTALSEQSKIDEAIACFQAAIRTKPDYVEAYSNLGIAYGKKRQLSESENALRTAVELDPKAAIPHNNLSYCLLSMGKFRDGWVEHEWRIPILGDAYSEELVRLGVPTSIPEWTGEKLVGHRILLLTEQGLGDSIHFIRYASLLYKAGARVHVICQPQLTRVFETVDGIEMVLTTFQQSESYDYRCWLLSLPRLFQTDFETMPCSIPYLTAADPLIDKWNAKLSKFSEFKVGIVWAGSSAPRMRKTARRRDIPVDQFGTLASIQGITLFSLQRRDGSSTALETDPGWQFPLIDLSNEFYDFAETAAAIANLDLIISADTAVAHLAGALGKPIWLLSRFDGCWRWLEPRTDSPWYPTMNIYWQRHPGDWAEIFVRVKEDLMKLISQ